MSSTFDPQFHTRIARNGQRSVWLAAPFPKTVLPQKTALYRAWRAEECRRLQADGDIVLNRSQWLASSAGEPAKPAAAEARA